MSGSFQMWWLLFIANNSHPRVPVHMWGFFRRKKKKKHISQTTVSVFWEGLFHRATALCCSSEVPLEGGPMSDSPLPWKWAEHSQCLSLLVSYPVFPRKTETLKVGLKCSPCLPQFLTLSLVCWLIGFLSLCPHLCKEAADWWFRAVMI